MNNDIVSNIPCDPIQAALINSENYHDKEEWFPFLQEDGIGFSKLDASHWEKILRSKK